MLIAREEGRDAIAAAAAAVAAAPGAALPPAEEGLGPAPEAAVPAPPLQRCCMAVCMDVESLTHSATMAGTK